MARKCKSCIRYVNGRCKHYDMEVPKDMIACKEHFMTKEMQVALGRQISAKRKRKKAKNAINNTRST